MIHVASSGEMPFVSNVRKTRSNRTKLQNQSPVKAAKLTIKSRASEKLNPQEIKRIKLATVFVDGSVGVKHRSGHLRSALGRLRQTILHPMFEKGHIHHNHHTTPSHARPVPNKSAQRKPAKAVRTVGFPPRTYTVCEECSRKCANLEVIMEEDFDEDSLSEEIETKVQLTASSYSLGSVSMKSQSLASPYNNLLSV
ncbi:unnamed protein product [Hymenolepis diminuta]|uniref:Uncharacterized protein n=1 Tax=Hymenolepis diminuta TaxID=6216 RepID=A0A0R3SCF3_HYMDI|nr:unnamed protein product [Hymenolepis diminuta]VUZ39223.1 unnamed protein product [Hymenolepis diminuta]